jgi:hypothetical protein
MPIPTLTEFRTLLKTHTTLEIVQQLILGPEAKHLTGEKIDRVARNLRARFGLLPADKLEVHLVGSAKLGFSIVDKMRAGHPRYRVFSPESDFDFAVVSQRLFYNLWREIGRYSHRQRPFPWRSDLSHYMLVGWIRPDHFPADPTAPKCQEWWELFGELSADAAYGGRRVRGALFFSRAFLEEYQSKAVLECQQLERMI